MTESNAALGDDRHRVTEIYPAAQIAGRVAELGRQITAHYDAGPLVILGVMTGGVLFFADLVRKIARPLELGVLHARSYTGTQSGELQLNLDDLPELRDKHVLLVDDIFDTGQTLRKVLQELAARSPATVRSVVLLRKAVVRRPGLEPDWVAFEIADQFVVGYGLDFDGKYRNAPGVCVLSED